MRWRRPSRIWLLKVGRDTRRATERLAPFSPVARRSWSVMRTSSLATCPALLDPASRRTYCLLSISIISNGAGGSTTMLTAVVVPESLEAVQAALAEESRVLGGG